MPTTGGSKYLNGLWVPSVVNQVRLITAGFTQGRGGKKISAVVWHTLEGYLEGALSHWNKGNAGAHFVIMRTGLIVLTCKLTDTAWHAGTSYQADTYGRTPFWRENNINSSALGVEIEGFAHQVAYDYQRFTPEQVGAITLLANWITAEYGVLRQHTFDQISGHHSHGELSANRSDPGPVFDWAWVLGK